MKHRINIEIPQYQVTAIILYKIDTKSKNKILKPAALGIVKSCHTNKPW